MINFISIVIESRTLLSVIYCSFDAILTISSVVRDNKNLLYVLIICCWFNKIVGILTNSYFSQLSRDCKLISFEIAFNIFI